MSKLAGRVVFSADELAVHHDPDTDAVRDADIDDVVKYESVSASRPDLCEGACLT
jgi:hypothetical protein